MASDSFWIVVILLVLFIEPLRDTVWGFLVNADPLMLVVLLLVVWFLGKK
ncbi:MAG: hypothetical protein V1717_01665 [Candidatus Micrarchaeota archaeon]